MASATTDLPPQVDPETETDPDEKSVLGHLASFAKELFFVVVGAIIVASLLRMFVGQMFLIPSPSMESTLMTGDRVVAQKITDFNRGDVVVFEDPGGWLRNQQNTERGPAGKALQFIGVLPDLSKGDLVKRVVGMPGDRVVCCDGTGKITVNGQPLDETSYIMRDASGKQLNPSDVTFDVVVPKDKLFVLGDNRKESADSRCHLSDVWLSEKKGAVAFVPIDMVVGPAFAVVAPFNHAKRLKAPEIFSTVPVAAQPAPEEAVIKPAGVTC